MPIVYRNQNTAILAANLLKEGRIVLFDPLNAAFAPGFVDLGYFPTADKIAPTNTVNRTAVVAASREGGPDVTLADDVTSVGITYAISSLTADDAVKELHAGSAPVTLSATGVATTTAFLYDPSVSVSGRMIIVRKRLGTDTARKHRVVFHPRVDLSPNGTGDANGKDTLVFLATVRAYPYVVGAEFSASAAAFGQYGAQFEVPDAELTPLLDFLAGEALPV